MTPREIEELANNAGLMIVSIERKMHYKVRLRRVDGAEKIQVISCTDSDQRAHKNRMADMRRFARGDSNK